MQSYTVAYGCMCGCMVGLYGLDRDRECIQSQSKAAEERSDIVVDPASFELPILLRIVKISKIKQI